MQRVWRIRADHGRGWIRDVDDRGVIVTGLEAEAAQWPDLPTAAAALRLVDDHAKVPHHLVVGPAPARIEWGDPR